MRHLSQQPALGSSGSGHVHEAWLVLGWKCAPGGWDAGMSRQEASGEEVREDKVAGPQQGLLLCHHTAGFRSRPRLRCTFRPTAFDRILTEAPGGLGLPCHPQPRLTPSHRIRFTPGSIFSLLSPARRMHPHERGDEFISVAENCSHVRGSVTAGKSLGLGGRAGRARPSALSLSWGWL